MKRLLNRIITGFVWYSLIVLIASIPAYYYLVDSIWLNELDENNLIIAERTTHELNKPGLNESDLEKIILVWNKVQPGANIKPVLYRISNRPDSIYTILKENKYPGHIEKDRFRVLSRYFHINGHPYELIVETNVEESEETILAIAVVAFIFFMILISGFLLLNKYHSKHVWKPLKNSLQKLKQFNLNNSNEITFDKTNIIEFHELDTALTKLISHTVSVYKTQKAFIENASHELQTPLAIIQAKLDLLLQQQDVTQKQYEIIEEINNTVARIVRINKSLLLLAKLDNAQFDTKEPVSFVSVINHTIAQLKEYFEGRGLSVNCNFECDKLLPGNKMLTEILVGNLLLNAIKYSTVGEVIIITLQDEYLTINNPGTKPLDANTIFSRFYKPSHNNSGAGIGLSLVKEIARFHQWEIEYSFRQPLHVFKLIF